MQLKGLARQLVLAVRQREVICHGFVFPRRDLYLGIIDSESQYAKIDDKGIVLPTTEYVKSHDNVGLERASGNIVLPDSLPMDKALSWSFLSGDDPVKEWLSGQHRHPNLRLDLLRMLGCSNHSGIASMN